MRSVPVSARTSFRYRVNGQELEGTRGELSGAAQEPQTLIKNQWDCLFLQPRPFTSTKLVVCLHVARVEDLIG